MEQELVDGVWKRKLVRHIGTAKSDLELEILTRKAKEILDELKRPNQLRIPFSVEQSYTGNLRTVGEFYQGQIQN